MRRALQSNLRARILLPTAVLFAVTLVAMVVVAARLFQRDAVRQRAERAELLASVVSSGVANLMLKGSPDRLPELLAAVGSHRGDLEAVSVLRPNGEVAFSSQPELLHTRPWPNLTETHSLVDVDGDGAQALLRPLNNERACSGCHGAAQGPLGWLELRFSAKPLLVKRASLLRSFALPGVLALLALLAIAWTLLGREAIRPLARLLSAMERARRGDLGARADEGRPDELGKVARGFDAAMDSLQSSRARLESLYRERMLRADRFAALGELATGLAHEVKNPLAGLSGGLELLAEDLAGTPRQSELIAEMRHQVARLARTMDGLLSYARPPQAAPEPTDVNEVLRKVLFLVAQQRSTVSVEIRADFDEQLPDAYADPAQLEQVFLNLVLNAYQAMSGGGILTVRTASEGERVVVELQDDGPGIPEPLRARIFEPFFTTRRDGNGLGLSIAARIVEEHRGHIHCRCPESGGTVFTVALPRAASAQERAA